MFILREKEREGVRGCSVCNRLAFSTAVHTAKRKSTGGAAGLDLPVNGCSSDTSVRLLVTRSGPDPSDLDRSGPTFRSAHSLPASLLDCIVYRCHM